ncbi:putative RNA-directed DNA polymerase from transposon BS [Trichonephila clavipes]|uniref:Putative RNA-directed DNA polymerase from transposon BS n=1 Tax=Trichonephila clavipes TaxID=2585209 RepID=A0A8X6WDV7_TRICX|nr:putative RNA-directed DNA polymerase from transposon BS [Trichonephila clavipes]
MQESKISVWCKKWKLSTSPEKSSLINFSRKRSAIPTLPKICDKPIPEVKSLKKKILGIIFDPNITWKNHINYLRQKGFKYLNAIKALSPPKIGTRSDNLLNIINATIRFIFDYGSQLFSFSSNSNRQKLEPIYNAALRLALGLPRNTPLDLLRAESMNGSINNRHNFLYQKFITKQIALKNWSPNARLFINKFFYKYKEKEISIFQKSINLLQELCISKVDILQWIPPPPIYENRKINIYTQELPFQNKDLPDDLVQNMFNDYIQPKFNNNIIIATYGSKNTNQTSIGILIPKKKVRQNFVLKEMISIFTAEAIAIWTALKNWVSETENYIILTDSLLVLKSIQNINRKSNTVILNLSSTLHQCLQIAQSITFTWVPAHKGIGNNEEVDKLAKASPEPWNIIP